MPDWNVVTEGIKGILELLFGPQVPLWVPRALGWTMAAGVALVSLYALLWVVSQILEVWDEKFRTRFYNETERRRSERRRRFASRVEGKLRDLEDQEEWKDFRFAELEAEVEAEGKRRGTGILGRLRTESGLRREKSLSRALKITKEEIVLLEGDPGSGKSVALRHVAQEMARQAMSARSTRSIVPLYINLKGLDRAALAREMGNHHTGNAEPSRIRQLLETHFDETELRNLAFDLTVAYDALPGGDGTSNKARELVAHMQRTGRLAALVSAASALRPHLNWNGADGKAGEVPIDSALIHAFVRHSFSWSRDIEEFLDEEFECGREEGTWLFLFDSFDELPDVLGSTEADDTIRRYADAIEDFLGGMGRCRGIIASRHFRGPKSRWPRFRILPLTEERRQQLIRRAELKPAVESDLRGQLGMASEAIRAMVSNPMFLGLLCEHMRQGEQFPRNTHEVFEGYITTRLDRDRKRLEGRFHLEPTAVRAVAESAAFAMAADTTLGLSPTRAALSAAIQRLGLAMPAPLEPTLDALEYIKLGRAEGTSAQGDEPRFTFAHRRFQEYFATSIVLRDPHRVPPRRLLTDARWRETAVVLCQTQPLPVLAPLLDEARALLDGMLEEVKEYLVDVEKVLAEQENSTEEQVQKPRIPPIIFPWPARSLHLLGLLQDGFGRRRDELANDVRDKAAWLLLSGSERGILLDRKWALEVAGGTSQAVLLHLISKGFDGEPWLRSTAYLQAENLASIPEEIISKIRDVILHLALSGKLWKQRQVTYAHLSNLDKSYHLLQTLMLALRFPLIDFLLHLSLFLLIILTDLVQFTFVWFFVCLISFTSFYMGLGREDLGGFWLLLATILTRTIIVLAYSAHNDEFLRNTIVTLSIYTITWGPFGVIMIKTGEFLDKRWSIFAPIVLALQISKIMKSHIDNFSPKMIIVIPILVFIISAFYYLLNTFVEELSIISAIFSFSLLIYAFKGDLLVIYGIVVDHIKWWRKKHQFQAEPNDKSSIKRLLITYETPEFVARHLHYIARKKLILTDGEIVVFLENLILAIEGDEIPDVSTVDADLLDWYNQYEKKPLLHRLRWSHTVLDELCLLLEHVRANRREEDDAPSVAPALPAQGPSSDY